MSETEISKDPADLPEPHPEQAPKPKVESKRVGNAWHKIGFMLLCFVASFLGAWVLLATGLVRPDVTRTLNENKETLVLSQGEIVAEVFKRVNPSTVAITTESVAESTQRFFAPQVTQGAGSGVILSKDGYVLTNKHVVPQGTNSVTVITSDGKQYKDVKVIGRDPSNDIAFLKINGVNNLTPAQLGDSAAIEPGQQVVAIGNVLGLFRNSVTSGIISGIGRPVLAGDESGASAEQLEDMLQTDAAINSGNSGGPLVNLKGEVIGVNTAVSADGQSVGFAIPINTAKGIIKSVLEKGQVIKAYLGVRYITIDQDVATELALPVSAGALIRSGGGQAGVIAGSPAAQAGLKEGDIITKIKDKPLGPGAGLVTQLSQFAPGDKVEMTIVREGKEQKVTVTLAAFPQQ